MPARFCSICAALIARMILFLAISLHPAAAALPCFETFSDRTSIGGSDYAIGSPLAGQTDGTGNIWNSLGGNFPGAQPTIAAGSLSYPGLPVSSGNSVSFVPANSMGARLNFNATITNGTRAYYSFILKITDISAVPTTSANNYFAAFSDGPAAQVQQLARAGTRLLTKRVDSGYVLGVGRNNTTADYVYDTTVHNVDDLVFVVGSHEVTGGVTNVNLWINPPSSSFGSDTPPAATLTAVNSTSTTGALNTNGVQAFVILCQYTNAPSGVLDELRVGTHWAAVTGGDPVIIAEPQSRSVTAGGKAIFAVTASGSAPLSYQWWFNGTPIPEATTPAHAITDAQPANEGDYSVVVSNLMNVVTSSVASLTIASNLQLQSTNLIVIRVGDGAQPLTMAGNSMSLDQFDANGDYLNSVSLPDQGPSALITFGWNHVNHTSGSVTGSGLTRSHDGRHMVVAGYNVPYPFATNLNNTTASAVPRGIGLVDSNGQFTLPVSSQAAYNNTFWRAAVTDGTNNYWGAGGTSGTYYFGFDDAAATIQNQFSNVRGMGLFNGSIYVAGAVAGNNGVLKLDGMPKTAVTPTLLFAGSTGTTELEVSPNGNLIYVADDRAISVGGGIQRWEFNGSTWSLAYTLTNGFGDTGPRYVTAKFSGANPVLYAVTKEPDNNQLVLMPDTGANSVGTTVARAGANQIFRGLRFGPGNETLVDPPVLSISRDGTNVVLSWEGDSVLQSATSVTGPYENVPDATSPHPVSLHSATQLFFRLEQ